MKLVKRVEAALHNVMLSSPVVGFLGIVGSALVLAAVIVFVFVKAPNLGLTVLGVVLIWIMVVFISKFMKEMKR